MTGVLASSGVCRSWASMSKPFISGICTSLITRSGLRPAHNSRPAAAILARGNGDFVARPSSAPR